MKFDDVIFNRRSIRMYLDKEVSNDEIEKIIDAGILAPSAHNRQPWKVKIVRNAEKNKIAKALENNASNDESKKNTARIIKEAPVMLVIFYEQTEGERDNDILSLGAFIQNMHLKATELNLGSLWIANTNCIKEEIKKITSVDLECISCLAIGYKNQNPKQRPRKDKNEVIIR